MSAIQNVLSTLTNVATNVADALQDTELLNDDKR